MSEYIHSKGNYPPGVTGNEPELNDPGNLCPQCEEELDEDFNCPACGYSTPRCPACDSPTGRMVNYRMTCCRATSRDIQYLLCDD